MYKLLLHRRAAKYYGNLDDTQARRINKAIESMIKNPLKGSHIKKLKGKLEGKYRYAIGDLRIIFRVNSEERTVFIEAIGPRGDIYK